MQYLWLIETDL